MSDYLDIQRVNGAKIGHLTWSLSKLKSMQLNINNNSDPVLPQETITHQLAQEASLKLDDLLEFRYCSGTKTNTVLACSIQLPVKLPQLNTGTSFDSFLHSSLIMNRNMSTKDDDFITFRICGKLKNLNYKIFKVII